MTIIIEYPLLLVLGSIIWISYRIIFNIIKKNKVTINLLKKEIIYLLFIDYLLLLIGITIFPIRIGELRESTFNLNLIPFNFNIYGNNKIALIVIIGNLVLLSPIAIFLPIINQKKFKSIKKILLISFLISLSIEVTQFITVMVGISDIIRVSDINDIILNTVGSILGYYIYKNLLRKFIIDD